VVSGFANFNSDGRTARSRFGMAWKAFLRMTLLGVIYAPPSALRPPSLSRSVKDSEPDGNGFFCLKLKKA